MIIHVPNTLYQEDIIAFLQKVCGLSGSYADTVRRGIARKKPEILEEALPKILDGYCSMSTNPRDVAEKECQEFLQIIEDASSYMFGYNHSIAYCLLGYLCAYYRYYHPAEFITAFLNNAANDDDIQNGTVLAKQYGFRVVSPKFGISRGDYFFDLESKTIAKGLSSIKGIGKKLACELASMSDRKRPEHFVDLLFDLKEHTSLDSQQLTTLMHIDYFSDYGNQRELDYIVFFYNFFKRGDAKQIKKEKIEGSIVEDIVRAHSTDRKKDGTEASSYTLTDVKAILLECEAKVLSLGLKDLGILAKVRYFTEAMGYTGYVSGREEDRPKLYIRDVLPLKRKKDGKQFGYSLLTQSIGSGIESRFTVFNRVFTPQPVAKGDVIVCTGYTRDGKYFTMDSYKKLYSDEE